MIRYSLCCDEGHRFDSWFGDSAAFDAQAGRGLVACPRCGSPHVAKAIMAPAVVSGGHASRVEAEPAVAEPAKPADPEPTREVALLDPAQREMRDTIRAFRDKVMAETQDVGRRFSDEARRIHDGEVPERRIRGQATMEEARDLLEDGIMVLPLPNLPDDLN